MAFIEGHGFQLWNQLPTLLWCERSLSSKTSCFKSLNGMGGGGAPLCGTQAHGKCALRRDYEMPVSLWLPDSNAPSRNAGHHGTSALRSSPAAVLKAHSSLRLQNCELAKYLFSEVSLPQALYSSDEKHRLPQLLKAPFILFIYFWNSLDRILLI